MRVLRAATSCLAVVAALSAGGGEAIVREPSVEVATEGIAENYAKAIARTVTAARAVASTQFGFELPETIRVSVHIQPEGKQRLWNDGVGQITQVLGSERDLLKPARSGIFNVYGYCHEVGHICMYRAIPQHAWMTEAAAEGWAHYLGSRIVDAVHSTCGNALWPDAYDYSADGTARLNRELAKQPGRDNVTTGAGAWQDFVRLAGDRGPASLFKAWGAAKLDPAKPAAGLKAAFPAGLAKDARVTAWWTAAETQFIQARKQSPFEAHSADPAALTGKPVELKYDDGVQAGKFSFAGGGHAVRFKAPGAKHFLTEVLVYGARYGMPQPPAEDFHVFLCDKDGATISDTPLPYARFARGVPQWVKLKIAPTEVPEEFIVCLSFDPHATKGVFVFHDKSSSGASLSGLPEYGFEPFKPGAWMIRATLDRMK